MTTVLALPLLYERVAEFLADEGSNVNLAFGWRESRKQINQGFGRANRVVFEPGVGGKLGTYGPARRPGRNPRPIANLEEQATVYVWARNADAPDNDLAQYTACRLLHDAIVRAIHLCAMTTVLGDRIDYSLSDPSWARQNAERIFGAELTFTLTVGAAILDEGYCEIVAAPDVDYVFTSPTEAVE